MGPGTTEPFRYEPQGRYSIPWRLSRKQIVFAAAACFGLVIFIVVIIHVTTLTNTASAAKEDQADGKNSPSTGSYYGQLSTLLWIRVPK